MLDVGVEELIAGCRRKIGLEGEARRVLILPRFCTSPSDLIHHPTTTSLEASTHSLPDYRMLAWVARGRPKVGEVPPRRAWDVGEGIGSTSSEEPTMGKIASRSRGAEIHPARPRIIL